MLDSSKLIDEVEQEVDNEINNDESSEDGKKEEIKEDEMPSMAVKKKEHEELEDEINAFLKKGGKIEHIS